MQGECTKEATTVEEAVDAALEELGVQQDAVEYEVLEEPGKKMFGFGGEKLARVRVWIKDSYAKEIEDARKSAREILEVDEGLEPEDELPAELVAREAPAELSDEELDKVADTAVGVLKEVLTAFGIEVGSTTNIEEYEGDEGEIILDVVGGDVAVLIGRHGRTLEALQALVSAITNRRLEMRYPVLVDIEGYRHRRRQKLEEIARKTADRASRQGSPVRMRPMNAYERRVVHVALRNDRRVATSSEGEDPFRAVVVRPK
jgi:spoIIIJ-associated protein